MKKLRNIFLCVLLAVAGNALADELRVQPVNFSPGEQTEVAVELENKECEYIMTEFFLQLPEGISIAKDEDGELLCEPNSVRFDRTHTLLVELGDDGAYHFLIYSSRNKALKGNSGALFTMTLQADASIVPGQYRGRFYGQVFSDVNKQEYNPDDVSFTITVNSAAQPVTITAKSYTREYGEANPTFEFSSEGETLVGTPTISCEATATSPVGTYPIIIRKGTVENELDTYVNGTLTITKAPLTISAGTYTKKQGEAMPEFKPIYSGFKNGESSAVLKKQPTVSCEATEASAPGEYDVTVSGAEADNYSISYQQGKLIVESGAFFDDRMKVETVTVGKSITMCIGLENKTPNYVAFQFDLTLPEGFTLAVDSRGIEQVTMAARFQDDDHFLDFSKLHEGNTWRFACLSLSNGLIKDTQGALLNVILTSEDDVEDGTYEGRLSNIRFVRSDGTEVMLQPVVFSIVVNNIVMGDTNGDGEVNVSDIVEIVNCIMGTPSAKFVRDAADMNGDGEVNVTDIVQVVNVIMAAGSANSRCLSDVPVMTDNDRLKLTENSDHSLSLEIENEGGYVASQFDLKLGERQTLKDITLNEKRSEGHMLTYAKNADNTYKVIVYSLDNSSFSGHSGDLLNIHLYGSGSVEIDNIVFVTNNYCEKRFASLGGTTTGIEPVRPSSVNIQNIYDLQGRRLLNAELKKGIFIKNNKKYVVR